jgi:hypothetical protein
MYLNQYRNAAGPSPYLHRRSSQLAGCHGGSESGGVLRRAQPQGRGRPPLQAGPRLLLFIRSRLLPLQACRFLLPFRLRPRRRSPVPSPTSYSRQIPTASRASVQPAPALPFTSTGLVQVSVPLEPAPVQV